MSWQRVKSILKTEFSLHEKVILIALHTYANKQGECWPSVQTLMEDCGLSKSSVLRAVRRLEELGELELDRRHGRSTVYRLMVSHRNRCHTGTGVTQTPTGVTQTPTGVTQTPTGVTQTPITITNNYPENETTELHPSTGEIVRALGIVSPGYIAEAEEQIDVWLKAGVPFAALVEAATKSRGKKNPVAYMRSVVKPELEAIAKRKKAEAEAQRRRESGPDWESVMRTWAHTRQWPYMVEGIGSEPWQTSGVRVPKELLDRYAAEIEDERQQRAWIQRAAPAAVEINF